METVMPSNDPMLSGLFRRFLADLLDVVLLFVFATCLTHPFASKLFFIGENGLWIGLFVTLLYSGFLHTALGSGQTLGKKVLGIQVVRLDGTWMSLPASLFRFLIIACWTYNYVFYQGLVYQFPILQHPTVLIADRALMYGVFLSTFLMIPFHPFKRGLHDLATGSIVVYKGRFDAARLAALANPQKERQVYASLGLIFVLTLSSAWMYSQWHPEHREELVRMESICQLASQVSDLQNVGAREFHSHSLIRSGPVSEQRLIISGYVPEPLFTDRVSCSKQAQKIYAELHKNPDFLKNIHWVDIVIRTGWNLGIAYDYQSTSYPYQVDEVARNADQYAQGEAWGDANQAALAKYKVTEYLPDVKIWMDRYVQKDFVAIEKFVDEKNNSKDPLDSRFLDVFIPTLSAFKDENDLRQAKERSDAWITARPRSWLAWVVRGNFYLQYAWQARGNGFANTVNSGAYQAYLERVQIAQSALEKAQRLNPHQPYAATNLICVAYSLGLDRSTMEKYYRQAMSATPWAVQATQCKFEYLMPKWHGSLKDVAEFMQEVQEKSKKYPLLGLTIVNAHLEVADTEVSFVDYMKGPLVWPMIEQCYDRIFKAYPTHMNFHMGLASTATRAQEFAVAARQFDIVGDQWMHPVGWPTLKQYNDARAYAYGWVGWDLIQHDHDKEGAAMFYKSYAYNSQDSWVLSKLAEWNRMNGHPDKAKEFDDAAAKLKASQLPGTASPTPPAATPS